MVLDVGSRVKPAFPAVVDGVILLDGHRLNDVAAMVAGEDEELARRFGWWPARSTRQDGQAAVERWQHQWRTSGSVRTFAVREAATSVLVGGCEIRIGEHGDAAMSYWVFSTHRRRGFASRAVRLASGYAFAELGVTRLELHVAADNLASRGVARRAGFGEGAGPARCGPIVDGEVLYSRVAPSPARMLGDQ